MSQSPSKSALADAAADAQAAATRAAQALRLVCAELPHLSGLAQLVRILPDRRVPVAAITPTGRLLVNPALFQDLPLREAVFVIAHELLHIALRTHERKGTSDPRLCNIAHDYIINDILSRELRMPPPLGGLHMPGASDLSFEKLVLDLGKKLGPQLEKNAIASWNIGRHRKSELMEPPAPRSAMQEALRAAGLLPEPEAPSSEPLLDVIPEELERQWFPDTDTTRRAHADQLARAAVDALSLQRLLGALAENLGPRTGTQAGGDSAFFSAVQDAYQPPWQMALVAWMDAVTPGDRTYARASRRAADRTDCVLPGRKREGWTLHVILDTSGSMYHELGACLGAIASFCQSAGVHMIRIIHADAAVQKIDWVEPEALASYEIRGMGGSDLTPAMNLLADDPEVTAALILTDGYINYPQNQPPYDVLWVFTADWNFNPRYGACITLHTDTR